MPELLELIVYVLLACAASWAGGYAVAEDSWWADSRADLEDRAYWDGAKVRDEHPDANEFWARARPVLIRPEVVPSPAEVAASRGVAVSQLSRRDLRETVRPRRRANRLATVTRGKVVDMLGCPICSGWWAGSIIMAALVTLGPLDWHWWCWPTAQLAGWGLAHRSGWE
jgi:hypothetical protein